MTVIGYGTVSNVDGDVLHFGPRPASCQKSIRPRGRCRGVRMGGVRYGVEACPSSSTPAVGVAFSVAFLRTTAVHFQQGKYQGLSRQLSLCLPSFPPVRHILLWSRVCCVMIRHRRPIMLSTYHPGRPVSRPPRPLDARSPTFITRVRSAIYCHTCSHLLHRRHTTPASTHNHSHTKYEFEF